MNANVIDFRHAKARRIALARAEYLRELAEELGKATGPEGRAFLAAYYLDQGWATSADIKMALALLEEA